MYRSILTTAVLVFSTQAWGAATLTLGTPSGASRAASTPAIVFGAVAGTIVTTPCLDTNGNTTTCNTCNITDNPACAGSTAPLPLCACSENRIYDSLILSIPISVSESFAGTPRATYGSDSTLPVNAATSDSSKIDFRWIDICQAAESGVASCTNIAGVKSLTVKVFIDAPPGDLVQSGDEPSATLNIQVVNPGADNYNAYGSPTSEGIGTFLPYPGDQKIRMEQLDGGGFPSLSYGGTVNAVRVYISTDGLSQARPDGTGTFSPADLPVDGSEISNNIVDGLENGTLYFFRVALIDQAGNIVQFFPPLTLSDPIQDNACNVARDATCIYSSTPDQVLGILSNDFNCFIATAAFGSSFGPQLEAFRSFRHNILLRHDWGRWFVKQYYKIGPYGARFIGNKPILRMLVRGALWPAYGFSLLAVRYGLGIASIVATIALVLLSCLGAFITRKFTQRGSLAT